MRLILVSLLLLAPFAAADVGVHSPCNDWLPSAGLVDESCLPIHPGARMANGCTLNWVVTDGVDLYIGTAKHCTGALGEPLRVDGIGADLGTLAFQGRNDSAFYRVAPEARGLVDGALHQWGGPTVSPTGVAGRTPLPGEPLVHYGWGYYTKDQPVLRGRPAVTLVAVPLTAYTNSNLFAFATAGISGGDSGSPVMTATGQAAGHATAGVFPTILACGATGVCVDGPGNVALGVLLEYEMRTLSNQLGKPVTLVTGRPMVST